MQAEHATIEAGWGTVVESEEMRAAASRIADSADRAAAATDFWESVGRAPLWEREGDAADGWRVTFLWRGEPAVTQHVTLCGPVVFGETFAGGWRFEHIAETDIWHLTLRVPPGTRSLYAISPNGLLGHAETADEWARLQNTWVRDPLNPSTDVVPANPLWPDWTPRVYSLLEAPDAPAQRWRIPSRTTPRGALERHELASALLGNTRDVWLYTPSGWSPDPSTPLLVAFDGWETINVTGVPTVLDNLIAAGAIPPTVAVLVDCGTMAMRTRELDCHEPFVTFLTDEVLPWASAQLSLEPARSRTVVAGESLGGRAAVFAGLRRPDVFGNVIAQAVAVTDSGPRAIDALLTGTGDAAERLRVYLDAGLLETDRSGDKAFLDGMRRLADVMRAAGHDVHSAELPCGHDGIVMGEHIADALRLLLDGVRPS